MSGEFAGKRVLILMGSKSDWSAMSVCAATLKELGIEAAAHIASAHRSPDKVERLVREAEAAGVRVFIAAAGMAAHLAGAVAARTSLPVIGVPMDGGSTLGGLDALLSTVQMPPGVPVLTVGIGKAGARNAAVAAAQILATNDAVLRNRLTDYRRAMADAVERQDKELAEENQAHEKAV